MYVTQRVARQVGPAAAGDDGDDFGALGGRRQSRGRSGARTEQCDWQILGRFIRRQPIGRHEQADAEQFDVEAVMRRIDVDRLLLRSQ
jgi:hypothetical protein